MDRHFVLTTPDIEAAAQAAKARARDLGKPVSVAICDAGGGLLYFERIDDAAPLTTEIAMDKARCAALSRRSTGAWEESVTARPVLGHLPRVLPVLGGLPAFAHGSCLGGVGVAGATSQEDQQIAQAACSAIEDRVPAT